MQQRDAGRLRLDDPVKTHRVRKDEALGEEIVFSVGPDGKATQLTWHSNIYTRVR